MTYDLAIIGGGPAGVAAGVYASRKRLKTVFITTNFEGQSAVSDGVENWIGTVKIPGMELSENLKKHLEAYAGDSVDIKTGETAEGVTKTDTGFKIKTNKAEYDAKTILITTGSVRRKLDIPGAETFENKGLTYCASCDGPLFVDKDTVVIGGGNAAFESAAQLLAYTKSVTLLNRTCKFKVDPITLTRLASHPKMKIISNAIPTQIGGGPFVTTINYKDSETGVPHELKAEGIFVEIGLIPNTWFVKDLLELTPIGQIVVDPRTQQTSVKGIWAAGDATDGLYHQNNIAAGDAVKALEDIYTELTTK